MHIPPQDMLIYVLDLAGTAAFALSGALRAIEKRVDAIGLIVAAGATAVGGGMLRDVVLEQKVTFLNDIAYPIVILAAAALAWVFPDLLRRRESVVKYLDAVGLGVFSAIGASVAAAKGMNPLSVIFIACITGAGGGIIRDVLLGEMPLVLYREVYVSAVILGALALLALRALGADASLGFLAAMATTTLARCLGIYFGWSLPHVGKPR